MTNRHHVNFAAAALPSLLYEAGESVIYTPTGGGSARTITALIERQEAEVSATGRGTQVPIRVQVANDSTSGITTNEVVVNGDTLTLAVRPGETAQALLISAVLETTAAMLTVMCHGSPN